MLLLGPTSEENDRGVPIRLTLRTPDGMVTGWTFAIPHSHALEETALEGTTSKITLGLEERVQDRIVCK